MKENTVKEKSFSFAIRIIKLNKHLIEKKKEFVLSKQLLRSGTSIGALIREAEYAQSNKDFIHKMSVALKETNETEYWLLLLKESEIITGAEFESMHADLVILFRLLISIVKTSKTKL